MSVKAWGIAATAAGILIAGVPTGLHFWAVHEASEGACVEESVDADGRIWVSKPLARSLAILDRSGSVFWLRASAVEARDAAVVRCAEELARACGGVRDDAIAAARSNRDLHEALAGGALTEWTEHLDQDAQYELCSQWEAWFTWLADRSVDVEAICPVC